MSKKRDQEMRIFGIALLLWGIFTIVLCSCAASNSYDGDLSPVLIPSDSITVIIENHRTHDVVDPHFLLTDPGRLELGIVRGMGGKLVRSISKRWLGADGCTTIVAHYAGSADLIFDRLCWRQGDKIFIALDDIFTPGGAWSHR